MEAEARRLGVPFNSRTRDEVLADRLAKVANMAGEVSTPPPAPVAPAGTAVVRILLPNLWTSLGKHFAGDEVELSREEAEWLAGLGKVVIK